MNKLPITNINKWKKGYISNLIYLRIKDKEMRERLVFYNNIINHYFIKNVNSDKEGIELIYDNVVCAFENLTKIYVK